MKIDPGVGMVTKTLLTEKGKEGGTDLLCEVGVTEEILQARETTLGFSYLTQISFTKYNLEMFQELGRALQNERTLCVLL